MIPLMQEILVELMLLIGAGVILFIALWSARPADSDRS